MFKIFLTNLLSFYAACVDTLPVDEQVMHSVTTEVLKRAENAIFAKAINAIRPIEIKKICPERQKLYANESSNERDKSPISSANVEKPSDDLLQITVLNTEQERSVEIKSGMRNQRNKTPVRSIKERLGKKLNEDLKSRSRTPQQKNVSESRTDRSKSREREKRRENNRDRRYRSPKSSNDNRQVSNPRRGDSQKESDKSNRDKERRRTSSENRDTKDGKKNARDREDKDSQSNRDEHKIGEKTQGRDSDRDRELQKARVRARIREEERSKAQSGNAKMQSVNFDNSIKYCYFFNYTGNIPSDTASSKEKRPLSSSYTDRRKRSRSNTNSQHSDAAFERKRRDIDESNFEPNYDAHQSDESVAKKKTSENDVNLSKSKTKSETQKRSRSYSSSSSDSSSSDSSSDSEERKRKRKRKHKKQKKSKKSKKKKKTKK